WRKATGPDVLRGRGSAGLPGALGPASRTGARVRQQLAVTNPHRKANQNKMMSSIKQRIDREDEGFTLIELMVVLLIIAILLAIAIPTFLGARNTANARSSQENLRNALTAEHTNWTSNQSFDSALSSLEPSLTWGTANLTTTDKGARTVGVSLFTLTVAS